MQPSSTKTRRKERSMHAARHVTRHLDLVSPNRPQYFSETSSTDPVSSNHRRDTVVLRNILGNFHPLFARYRSPVLPQRKLTLNRTGATTVPLQVLGSILQRPFRRVRPLLAYFKGR
jgi:hypothetical protein